MQTAKFTNDGGGIYVIDGIIYSSFITNTQKTDLINSLNHYPVLSSQMLQHLETLGWSYINPFKVGQKIITWSGSDEEIIKIEKYCLVTKNNNEQKDCLPGTRLSNIYFNEVFKIISD